MSGIGNVGNPTFHTVVGTGQAGDLAAAGKKEPGMLFSTSNDVGNPGINQAQAKMNLPAPKNGAVSDEHISPFFSDGMVASPEALIEAMGMVMSDMALEMRKQQKEAMVASLKERMASLDKKKQEQLDKADKLKMGAIMSLAINLGAAVAIGSPGLGRLGSSLRGMKMPSMPKMSSLPKMPSMMRMGSKTAPPKPANPTVKQSDVDGSAAPGTKPAASSKDAAKTDGIDEAAKAQRLGDAQNSMMRMQAVSMSMQGMAGSTDGFFQAEAAVHDANVTGHEKSEAQAETQYQKAKSLAEEHDSFHKEVLGVLKEFISHSRSIGEAINSKV